MLVLQKGLHYMKSLRKTIVKETDSSEETNHDTFISSVYYDGGHY